MDTHEALLGRATVNRYKPEPIDQSALERALAAAVAAPNHRMTEPWRFTIVGRATREKLAELSVRLKAAKLNGPAPDALVQTTRAKMLDPAELIVVSQVLADDAEVREEDFTAVACAVQNLCLSLFADGIGSKWSSGAVTRDERTYRLLGIDAAAQRIVGFVWAGVPADGQRKPARKLSVGDVVRRME